MHLLISAYKRSQKDSKVLVYLLEKLWKPSTEVPEVTEEGVKAMSDKSLLALIGKMT